MFSLLEMLGRAAPRLNIVDVGAMWMDAEVPYRALLKGDAHVVGFEPVQAECDKLNALKMKNQVYLPYFIGDGSERTFYLCAASMTSSVYEPNMALLNRFQELGEVTRPVSQTKVATKRLDDIPEVERVDYLKVDVQGGDLDVLKGARRLLKDCAAVQTEVEFIPMYKGQPLFAEVDIFMREQGFLLHGLGPSLMGRTFKPLVPGPGGQRVNQLIWSDAVYVKDFMRFGELSPEVLLKTAIILHEVYGSCDLAALALQHYDTKVTKGLWKHYMTRLCRGTPPEPFPL
jgi:FkbM family methyltransferase